MSEVFSFSDYQYVLLPDGTAQITKYRRKVAELSILDMLDGKRVTSIGDRAFCYCDLNSVTLPKSVTNIGHNAFFAYDGLFEDCSPSLWVVRGSKTEAYCKEHNLEYHYLN